MKTYTIIKTHKGKTTETTGTLTELVEYFGYTLKAGASYNGQKGCKKVNESPKTIKSLMTALQNAVHNTQESSYEQDSYDYTEANTTAATPDTTANDTDTENKEEVTMTNDTKKTTTTTKATEEEPKKTKAAKTTKTAKTTTKTAKTAKKAANTEVTVLLRTFTGLKIGIYTGKLNNKTHTITIHIGRVGDVEFNLDGTQKTLNPSKNPKFNNKIEIMAEE